MYTVHCSHFALPLASIDLRNFGTFKQLSTQRSSLLLRSREQSRQQTMQRAQSAVAPARCAVGTAAVELDGKWHDREDRVTRDVSSLVMNRRTRIGQDTHTHN